MSIWHHGNDAYGKRHPLLLTLAVIVVLFLAIAWGAPGIDRQVETGMDFCYQLNMGRQLLLGKRPFVDFFFHYGPLVAYTSACGLTLDDSIVPETLFCALGYAVAIGLSFAVAQRFTGLLTALTLAGVQFLLMSRFYKWYYWFFPSLTALLLMRLCRHRRPRGTPLLLGLAAGVAFLFRMDLGIGCLMLALAGAGIVMLNRRPWRTLLGVQARVMAGFLVAPAVWVAWLTWEHGATATGDYFHSYLVAARGVTKHMGLPIPPLTWHGLQHPLAWQTATALAYRLLPVVALCGFAASAWLVVRRRADLHTRLLGTVCLGALVFFPQALHRSSSYHLLQVFALFALATELLLHRLWTGARTSRPSERTLRRLSVVLLGGLLTLTVLGLRSLWMGDLEFSRVWPLEKYRRLAVGLDAARPSDAARAIRFVRDHTTPNDTVLPLNLWNNFLFFTGRRAAGLTPCYVPGLLTQPEWQERNRRQIAADRPKYVLLVGGGPLDGKPENELARYLPRIWSDVERDYPEIVLQSGIFLVRGPRR